MKCLYRLFGGVAAVSLLALAPLAQAQPTGQGGGMGMGPGAGYGAGGGMGQGRGRGFALNNANTRGWALMTPEERTAHRDQMLAAKSYEECKNLQAAQHKIVQERATAQGKTLPAPRQNACDRMRARGFYK